MSDSSFSIKCHLCPSESSSVLKMSHHVFSDYSVITILRVKDYSSQPNIFLEYLRDIRRECLNMLFFPDLDLSMISSLPQRLISHQKTSPSISTSQVCHSTPFKHTYCLSVLPGGWRASCCFCSARHSVPAAAVLQEEVLEWAAAPTQKLHHLQQPGAIRRRGAGRLLLGLQHHANQGMEDKRAGWREAGWPSAQKLHRLLC